MNSGFQNLMTALKVAAMDADLNEMQAAADGNIGFKKDAIGRTVIGATDEWEENKHRRANNGQFTSGSSRGKVGGKEQEQGRHGKSDDEGKGKEEMSQDAAEKAVRASFEAVGGKIDSMKLVEHHLSVETAFEDVQALNKELTKRGLKAKKDGEGKTLHIAEDSADDYTDDPFFKILVGLCQIEMFAKDLHYRAKGKSFYGIHELADRTWRISSLADDINETYYMGEKGDVPPARAMVAQVAAETDKTDGLDTLGLIGRLAEKCGELANDVETAKETKPSSGTAAILDEVSKWALQNKGLLGQMLKNDAAREIDKDPVKPVDTSAIDKVIEKGIVIKP